MTSSESRAVTTACVVGLAALIAGACAPARPSTYRWGGRGAPGGYLVDMRSLKRTGPRVEFKSLFVPLPTPEHPDFAKLYVLADHVIDCAAGTTSEAGDQAYLAGGVPVTVPRGRDAQAKPIVPGSTFASVRDLVCRGSNDLDATPVNGTPTEVETQARRYMAAHPIG